MTDVPAAQQTDPDAAPVTQANGGFLDDILARIARAIVPETYGIAREKQHDDKVLGPASDRVRRMHIATDDITAELTPLVNRATAISERIHKLLPDDIETQQELDAAIQADDTMRALHAENMAIGEQVMPLNEMLVLLNSIIGAEVARQYPEARKHPRWAEIQMTKDWEIVVLSERSLTMLHRARMPAGLQGAGDTPVIILKRGDAAPGTEKKKPNSHLH